MKSFLMGGGIHSRNTFLMGGSLKTLTQLIKSLFSNNEVGFAYDPNDLTTLYQDAAGTIPVTGSGRPVGLMLDKSKGVAYSENLASTSKQQALLSQVTLNDGWWDITRTTSSFPGISQTSLEPNSLYKVKVSWKESTAAATRIEFNSSSGFVFHSIFGGGSGTWEGYVNSLDRTQLNVYFRDVVNAGYCGSIKIDSIQKIAGNHALQTTSSMRPLLQNSPRKIDYDGVDDKLITNLPAQLTGCTVIRAVPNVGTQILTNQTIPTPYNDSTDHCGLIVINRALTTAETAQITQLFNKAAGV